MNGYLVMLRYGMDDIPVLITESISEACDKRDRLLESKIARGMARSHWEKLVELDIGLQPASVAVAQLTNGRVTKVWLSPIGN